MTETNPIPDSGPVVVFRKAFGVGDVFAEVRNCGKGGGTSGDGWICWMVAGV